MDAETIQQQLDIEMKRLFQHFEEDEERTSRLAVALEQESTAAALHFALFPRRTRDGGLQVVTVSVLIHSCGVDDEMTPKDRQ